MQLNGFGYKNMPTASVLRNAYTISTNISDGELQINFSDGSKSLFTAYQFNFHAPSEHTVDGRSYDLEMHIMHHYRDEPKQLGAIIAIFFDRKIGGNFDNPLLDSLKFSKTTQGVGLSVTNVNLATFLSGVNFSRYWSYRGSITTPPCTEGLKWRVIQQVQPISDAQL